VRRSDASLDLVDAALMRSAARSVREQDAAERHNAEVLRAMDRPADESPGRPPQ
jgi:hypothetical protein